MFRYFKIDILIISIQAMLFLLSIILMRNYPVTSYDNSMMGLVFFPQIIIMAILSIPFVIFIFKRTKSRFIFKIKYSLSIYYIFISTIISINFWNTEPLYSKQIFFILGLIIYIPSFYFSNKHLITISKTL